MLLLDTHALLWFLGDDPKLSAAAKAAMESERDVYISIGSFWEIAIKESLGKLQLPVTISELIENSIRIGFTVLPIKADHLALLKTLPRIHGDPFDRLLICQAMSEKAALITMDENIGKYGVEILW